MPYETKDTILYHHVRSLDLAIEAAQHEQKKFHEALSSVEEGRGEPPETIHREVVVAICQKRPPHVAAVILEALRWDSMNGCYFFWQHGMYHGVEKDGHIHT